MQLKTCSPLLALALATASALPGAATARSSSTEVSGPALVLPFLGAEEVSRRGRGADDGAGHDAGDDKGGHGADDGAGHTALPVINSFEFARRGRGADDGAGHIRRGRGRDDGPNHA